MQESLRALAYLQKEMPVVSKNFAAPKGKGKKTKFIPPVVDNFRRTIKGGKLICQELKKLLTEQARLFSDKAMLNADHSLVRYTTSAKENKEITTAALMMKAPHFFSYYFATIRRKLDYGHKVQSWLSNVACR